MIIKSKTESYSILNNLRRLKQKQKIRLFASSFLMVVIFAGGALCHKFGYLHYVKQISLMNLKIIHNYFLGFTAQPDHIFIDIKYKNFQKLAYQREIALNRGLLIVSSDDYVPATVRHNIQTVNVKIRLKGDNLDHLKKDKWSFRVKVKGQNTLFKMKQFSIHHPETRNYIYEWLFQRILKREGILSLRYKFVNVTINGKNVGIYALEEHFDKHLVEHNRLREGPIIRFSESLFWETNTYPGDRKNFDSETYLSSDIDGFHSKRITYDPLKKSQYIAARSMLESFRNEKLSTSEVFDIEKLSKYIALSDLMGTRHGNKWVNRRFYFNPITSKLEPIGFDGTATKISSLIYNDPNLNKRHHGNIFKDLVFLKKYIQELERVSQSGYVSSVLFELQGELKKNLSIIYKDYPIYEFSTELLFQNQKYIQKVLNPVKGLHVYFKKSDGNSIELEIGNIQSMPLEVLNISYKDSVIFSPVKEIILFPKINSATIDYFNFDFRLPIDFKWSDNVISDLKIHYKVLGTSRIRQEEIYPWQHLNQDYITKHLLRQKPNIYNFSEIVVNELAKTIFIKKGTWNLDDNLIVPAGYTLVILGGTHINLLNDAKILSYSPLYFSGTEENPIIIQSVDFEGQGIAVINSQESSTLGYVTFKNLSAPSQNVWKLTGAITFYESPVNIKHCQFIGCNAEDALNIVRSVFTIEKSFFEKSYSDAIDVDFSRGSISDSFFVDSGNDAVDISCSYIDLNNVIIDSTGDKGISGGESSIIKAEKIIINGASAIAIASKDQSKILIKNINISKSIVGLSVYQKKSEFGPGEMIVKNLNLREIDIPYLVENNSVLFIDNILINPNSERVMEEVYEKKMSLLNQLN